MQAGAYVCVCGDGARMAPAVRAALADIHAAHIGGDPTAWLRDLAEKGRYQQDVFA